MSLDVKSDSIKKIKQKNSKIYNKERIKVNNEKFEEKEDVK